MMKLIILCFLIVAVLGLSQGTNGANERAKYVIVGGGTAGCTLAKKLSDNPSNDVVVIEAGRDNYEDYKHEAVIAYQQLNRDIPVDLRYQYSEENLEVYPGVSFPLRSLDIGWARVLGGGPASVTGTFNRLSPWDFERWNSTEWTFENTNDSWKEMENFTTYTGYSDPNYHGYDGPITINLFEPNSNDMVVAASYMNELNMTFNPDPSSGNPVGLHSAPRAIKVEESGLPLRQDTCSTLLSPEVRARSNLKLYLNSEVTRLVIKQNNNKIKIKAVEFMIDDQLRKVKLTNDGEAILSAGVINTPKILMLSGIGDCALLAEHGIDCVLDMPQVGDNLRMNVQIGMTFFSPFDPIDDHLGAVLTGYVRSDYADPSDPNPDGEITFAGLNLAPNQNIYLFQVLYHELANPGTVKIRSNSSYDQPIITTNVYKTYPEALAHADLMLKVRQIMDVEIAPGIKYFYETGKTENVVGDATVLAKWLQQNVAAAHKVGTCALHSVVDDNLKVYGVENLRIADNSIVPIQSRSHATAAGAALIGTHLGNIMLNE